MDQNFVSEAGKAIRKKRRALDLTQAQLAELAEMTLFSIQRIERGDGTNTKTLEKIFGILDIQVTFS